MSYDPWEAEQDAGYDRLYEELGPQWAEEHGLTPPRRRHQRIHCRPPAIVILEAPGYGESRYRNDGTSKRPLPNTSERRSVVRRLRCVEITIKHLLVKPIMKQ